MWIPAAALVGFGTALVFGDLITLPVDVYYMIYMGAVSGFLVLYARMTDLEPRSWMSRRLLWGVIAGVLAGFVLMRGVLAHPGPARLSGPMLAWAVFWRGLMYGAADGALLLAFPWIVVWRALEAESKGPARKLGAAVVAWVAILAVTTAYHLGYADFRSSKIVQPNIGSTIASVPTLVAANPVASPISHVFLHVTAVLHSPDTDLYLPPHREPS